MRVVAERLTSDLELGDVREVLLYASDLRLLELCVVLLASAAVLGVLSRDVLLVAVAASNTFLLPTHQVNALIMRPGGYKVKDYVKAGTGMTILFIIVVMAMLMLFYGIDAG